MRSFYRSGARIWIIPAGFLISAGLIYLVVRRLDWPEVTQVLGGIEPWPWVPLAALSYLIGHLFRGLRCSLLVRREAILPVTTASNIVVLGYSVNNILPARMGELARAGMLAERSGVPFSQALTVTFFERVLDGLTIVLLLAVTVLVVDPVGWIRHSLLLSLAVFSLVSAAISFALLRPKTIVQTISRVGQRLLPARHDTLVRLGMNVMAGLSYVRRPPEMLVIAGLSLVVWIFETGMFLLLMPALGIEVNVWWALLAMTVTNLGILAPSSPGFIGTFHHFCMQALLSVGVAEAVAVSYAFVVHVTFYIPITLWGVLVIFWYGIALSSTIAAAATAKRAQVAADSKGPQLVGLGRIERQAPEVESNDFFTALSEALVPLHSLDIEATDREQILADVARFVREQLNSLPAKLRLMFMIGTIGFKIYIAVGYLGLFCRLSLRRRVQAVEAWSYGWLPPARQLFRPLRSTALLSFYEHPKVQLALSRHGGSDGRPGR
jgi:uncharacterized protein (TIRG00374 family)